MRILFAGMQKGEGSNSVLQEGQLIFFNFSCRRSIPARESDGHYPKKRGDGWLEIELGDFFCTEGEDGELEMRVFDGTNYWKHGLIVEGIEIRPKEVGASPSS